MTDHRITTPDGRALQVLDSGPPDGVPLMFLQGMPNSRLVHHPWVELAKHKGVRLISYDRPGYGGSDPNPGRTVADCEVDIRAIASALEIDRIGVYGLSGGGPHAAAVAALMGNLVPAVAILGSIAPRAAEGLDYFEGMGQENVDDFRLYETDPAAARAKCAADRDQLAAIDAPALIHAWETVLAPVDANLISGEYADFVVASLHDGLAPGSEGWWEDAVAIAEPWGFELDAIRTPVLLLHGHHDRFVPFTHGQWLAERIPGAEARISKSDGHLTLTERHLPEIYDWLLERV